MIRLNVDTNKKRILLSMLLNCVVLLITFLMFEPTTKSDDYDMINLLYGGIDSQYSIFMLYPNVLFGKILVYLLNIMPDVAWYFVVQYILMVGANCIIAYVFLQKEKVGGFFSVLYLCFFAYEFYVRITFSKTAGFLIAAGYFLILCVIEKKLSIKVIIPSGIFIFFGLIIRGSFFELVSVIMLATFFVYAFEHGRSEWKNLLCFVFVVAIIWGSRTLLNLYSEQIYQVNGEWENYRSDNMARAQLVDYGIPNYDVYREQYESLGVSRNDYIFWFSYAMRGDNEILTNDLYKKMGEIDLEETTNYLSQIRKAIKNLLSYLKNNTASYLFWLSIFLFMLLTSTKKYYIAGLVFGLSVFAYIYMYVRGRTQHHVDAVVFTLASILMFYYSEQNRSDVEKIRLFSISLCVGVLFCVAFYNEIASSSYYGTYLTGQVDSQKELYKENRTMYQRMSDDGNHLYVIPPMETNKTFSCFTVFEVIEKGFYHNIYRTNMNHIPTHQKILKGYGINNIWREAVNSDVIRFAISADFANQMDCINTYIREHYNESAEYELVDSIGSMNIYRVYAERRWQK